MWARPRRASPGTDCRGPPRPEASLPLSRQTYVPAWNDLGGQGGNRTPTVVRRLIYSQRSSPPAQPTRKTVGQWWMPDAARVYRASPGRSIARSSPRARDPRPARGPSIDRLEEAASTEEAEQRQDDQDDDHDPENVHLPPPFARRLCIFRAAGRRRDPVVASRLGGVRPPWRRRAVRHHGSRAARREPPAGFHRAPG